MMFTSVPSSTLFNFSFSTKFTAILNLMSTFLFMFYLLFYYHFQLFYIHIRKQTIKINIFSLKNMQYLYLNFLGYLNSCIIVYHMTASYFIYSFFYQYYEHLWHIALSIDERISLGYLLQWEITGPYYKHFLFCWKLQACPTKWLC